MIFPKTLVLTGSLFLLSCGYQMGVSDPSASFQTYSLSGDPDILACKEAAERLENFGLSTEKDKNLSGFVLLCLIEELDRRAVSVDASSLGAEYRITYSVRYAIEDLAGKTLVAPSWIRRSDSFLYDRQNLLGTYNVESSIREELAGNVADQLIRVVSRVGSNL